MYEWDFGVILRNKWVFLHGSIITIQITLFAVAIGTALGGLLGLGRSAKLKWISWPSSAFVEFFLALPILVLLIWIYFCGPLLAGIRLSGFWAAVSALSLSLSAFVAEIVRSSIQAIPTGHVEAARALGLSHFQATRHIVLPQAIRIMTPPLLGMYIATLKMSSLASVIAVYELLHSAQGLISTSFRPMEIYTTVALVYVAMVLPLSILTRRFESAKAWRLT